MSCLKLKHSDFSDFKCQCGYSFPNNKGKLQINQENCKLSKIGATVAIKRKHGRKKPGIAAHHRRPCSEGRRDDHGGMAGPGYVFAPPRG